jgi:hypothetical protein
MRTMIGLATVITRSACNRRHLQLRMMAAALLICGYDSNKRDSQAGTGGAGAGGNSQNEVACK